MFKQKVFVCAAALLLLAIVSVYFWHRSRVTYQHQMLFCSIFRGVMAKDLLLHVPLHEAETHAFRSAGAWYEFAPNETSSWHVSMSDATERLDYPRVRLTFKDPRVVTKYVDVFAGPEWSAVFPKVSAVNSLHV